MDVKRSTIQRQLIRAAVRELNCHATAEQVYGYIASKYPSISKGTVYRNLSQMTQSGELLKINNFDDSFRYDHNCHNHYHFICKGCGRVFDVECYFDDLHERITQDFDITSHNITFGGLCSGCKVK